ncbi:glycosyl hydrolase family 3 C-terminal domain-containing protein [Fusarium oxysporum]|nr:glycosyl hydrolase family 3 C-terminal domain-containing protein [Fusarium oxysporum]
MGGRHKLFVSKRDPQSTTCTKTYEVNQRCWIKLSAVFEPDVTGDWEFGLVVAAGQGDLYIEGEKVIDNTVDQKPSGLLPVQVLSKKGAYSRHKQVIPMSRGAIELGGRPVTEAEEMLQEAERAAREADVAIVAVGLNQDWECEGYDRDSMKLPGKSDELVQRVLAANPRTVVILQSGTPVELSWVDHCQTLLQGHYGGNQIGNGIADVIFGARNPSGRLSVTYPYKYQHNPAFYNWVHEGNKTMYGEVEGRESVQIDAALPNGIGRFPEKELRDFIKVELGAGEKKTCSVRLTLEALAYFDTLANNWTVDAGDYKVLLGSSSRDIKESVDMFIETKASWLEYPKLK